MASVPIEIVVPEPAEVLQGFDRIAVFRSALEGGPFVEITTSKTRIVIDPAVVTYEFIDDTASATDWYRTSFYSTSRDQFSAQSDPFMASDDEALKLLPVKVFRERWLHGVNILDDQGKEYTDSAYAFAIRAGLAQLEVDLDLPIRRTVIVDEKHDWELEKWAKWGKVKLYKFPIISVESLKLALTDDGSPVTVNKEWISIRGGLSRAIHVKPQGGITSLFTQSGGSLWLTGMRRGLDWVPNGVWVSYTAGFPRGKVPANIIEALGMYAAFQPLNVAGDIVAGAGLQGFSLSMDGLSKSVTTANSSTNAGYGARLIQYEKQLKRLVPAIREHYHGGDLEVG